MTSKFFFERYSKIYRITYRITPKKMTFNKWKAIKSTQLFSLRRFLIYLYSTFGSLRLSSCKEKGNFLINFQYFPCHLLSLESWLRFLEEHIQYSTTLTKTHERYASFEEWLEFPILYIAWKVSWVNFEQWPIVTQNDSLHHCSNFGKFAICRIQLLFTYR